MLGCKGLRIQSLLSVYFIACRSVSTLPCVILNSNVIFTSPVKCIQPSKWYTIHLDSFIESLNNAVQEFSLA